MSDLLLNEATKADLDNFLARPAHALLLAGPDGSGRLALAMMLASELLGVAKLNAGASFRLVEPDEKGNISIEQVRQLKDFTKLKLEKRRVIVVADADKMQVPAQNSFLKLLEEPPENVFIILTAPNGSLKPTIVSRLQKINIRPVTLELTIDYFGGFDRLEVDRAYKLSGGRLGLMSDLLSANNDHPLTLAIDDARKILAGNYYERLIKVDELAKDKARTLAVLLVLGRMASVSLENAGNREVITRWKRVLAVSYRAEVALSKNANTKLVLTDLMLGL